MRGSASATSASPRGRATRTRSSGTRLASVGKRLFDVRPDERRPATLAFLALLGITAAHTLLETARDALFLTKVPITYLPALYLAIAGAGLVTTRIGAA